MTLEADANTIAPVVAECWHCKITKPVNEFYLNYGRPRKRCKVCYAAHNREMRVKHADRRKISDAARPSGWSRSAREKWAVPERQRWDRYLFRTYGIRADRYDEILASQGGVCAICKCECNRQNSKRFCVDHDHATGVVRGLLCFQCNVGLGKFLDNAAILREAANYLEK